MFFSGEEATGQLEGVIRDRTKRMAEIERRWRAETQRGEETIKIQGREAAGSGYWKNLWGWGTEISRSCNTDRHQELKNCNT